jgi:nucleotide-binding universal stress UspA family protein
MRHEIKKILVAIDFGEPSFNALNTAVCIAEKCGATLHIIHVQDHIFQFIGANAITINSVVNNSFSILTALASDIQKRSGIEPVLIEENGYATEMIVKSAVKHKCDLIVMGTYGASGFRNNYIGTTAYSVIKYAPCPVLIIPAGKKWESFEKPLFPVRPVITALRHYDTIRNLLKENSTLYILNLSSSSQPGAANDLNELVSEMKEKLNSDNITARIELNRRGPISQNILAQAEKSNSDLIIITPAIDVSPKHFYIGPNAHYVIHNARIPILVINKVNVYAVSNPESLS